MKNRKLILTIMITLCWTVLATADITNGGFETGDLTGWTSTGAVQAVTDEYSRDFLGLSQPPWDDSWDPTEGTYFASLWSIDGVEMGATLSQSFDAEAGDTLSFDYFFDFGDVADYPDTAMATLTWSGGSETLFDHNAPADDENIGWTTISQALSDTDTYCLTFEITELDGWFESILGVDDVKVTGTVIPAPGAILLGSIGVSLVGWLRRRRTL